VKAIKPISPERLKGGSSLERLRLHHIVIDFSYDIIQITSSSHLLMSDFHLLLFLYFDGCY
jgi:hypothetical protein